MEFTSNVPLGIRGSKKEGAHALFQTFSCGVKSNRDSIVYDFSSDCLSKRIKSVVETYNAEVDRLKREVRNRAEIAQQDGTQPEPVNVDEFVKYDRIKWSRDLKQDLKRGVYAGFDSVKMRVALFRPYTQKKLFFDRVLIEEVYGLPALFPICVAQENRVICVSDVGYRATGFSVLISNFIPELHLCASTDAHQCFPFYVYDEDGTNRRENITDWALDQYRAHYSDSKITKEDIFHYVYGILHHPGYRERYADCLKRELPRIPYAPDFRAFADAGRKLSELHLNYESAPEYPLEKSYMAGVPYTPHVEQKMKLSKDKSNLWVNPSITLNGIPSETFEYRLGNRSALEWIIDQYRVTENAKTGHVSDPNRPDDPEYIIRLVGQVVHVSVETVKLVNGLPKVMKQS